jgi:hypothetical protein
MREWKSFFAGQFKFRYLPRKCFEALDIVSFLITKPYTIHGPKQSARHTAGKLASEMSESSICSQTN